MLPGLQDPFPDGACLTRAAFSVYAASSLFSYIWVGNPSDCESVIVQVIGFAARHHADHATWPPSSIGRRHVVVSRHASNRFNALIPNRQQC